MYHITVLQTIWLNKTCVLKQNHVDVLFDVLQVVNYVNYAFKVENHTTNSSWKYKDFFVTILTSVAMNNEFIVINNFFLKLHLLQNLVYFSGLMNCRYS